MNLRFLAASLLAGSALYSVAASAQGIPTVPVTTDSFSAGRANSSPPAPGTVTVTLRTQLWSDIGYASDSGSVNKAAAGTSKSQGFQVQEFLRMYPKLDGVAANGMQYGGFVQIRQNSGANGASSGSTIYVRNAYSYVGAPSLGKIFVGGAPAALQVMMMGTLEGVDPNGGFNGSSALNFLNARTQPSWLPPDANGTYSANKIVYISPKFAGFDFGASFEPNYAVGASQCAVAGPACSNLASTPGGADFRRNTFDVAARYTGSFGPAAAIVEGGYWGSGAVNNSTGSQVYKGLDVFDAGVQATAYGFLIGVHYDGGAINSGYLPMHVGARKEEAFSGGVQYTHGTITGGVQLINDISAGTYNSTAKYQTGLHETGILFGAAVDYASGATAYATILYAHRHQSGIDLLNAVPGASNNNTDARVFAIGNVFRW